MCSATGGWSDCLPDMLIVVESFFFLLHVLLYDCLSHHQFMSVLSVFTLLLGPESLSYIYMFTYSL